MLYTSLAIEFGHEIGLLLTRHVGIADWVPGQKWVQGNLTHIGVITHNVPQGSSPDHVEVIVAKPNVTIDIAMGEEIPRSKVRLSLFLTYSQQLTYRGLP